MALIESKLKTAFTGEKPKRSRFVVKVTQKLFEGLFAIADDSDRSILKVQVAKPEFKLIEVGNCLEILDPDIDFSGGRLILNTNSSVFQTRELTNVFQSQNEDQDEVESDENSESDSEIESGDEAEDPNSYRKKETFKEAKLNCIFHPEKLDDNLLLDVEVLEQRAENRFLIIDESHHCEAIIDGLKPMYVKDMKEGLIVRIVNPEINRDRKQRRHIILDEASSVIVKEHIKKFQNDVKKITIRDIIYPDPEQCNDDYIFELDVMCKRVFLDHHFVIADASAFCDIIFDSHRKEELESFFKNGNFLTIKNPLKSKLNTKLFFGVKSEVMPGPPLEKVSSSSIGSVKEKEELKDCLQYWNKREECIGCGEHFLNETFYRHVSHSKKCKEAYGDQWPIILKAKRKKHDENMYKKTKEKRRLQYQEKKQIIAKNYQATKNEILGKRKEKRQKAKDKKQIRTAKPRNVHDQESKTLEKEEKEIEVKSNTGNDCQSEDCLPKSGSVNCKGCKKPFEVNSLLRHVSQKSVCKNAYGIKKFEAMKKEQRSKAWRKYEVSDKKQKWKCVEKILLEDGPNEVKRSIQSGFVRECKGCNEKFLNVKFFRHVSHSIECKKAYTDGEWESMKKERRSQVRRISRKRCSKKDENDASEEEDDKGTESMDHETLGGGDAETVNKNETESSSPEVMRKNENYIRKRKPIDFSMTELDALAEEDEDDEYLPE